MKNLLNLALHCGSHQATVDQVYDVKTPKPTESWCPIGHDELISSVIDTLGRGGLKVINEAHALWNEGNRYFGSFQMENGTASKDYALVVGLRNSHDKSFPAGLACGAGVFVCDNLSFTGEVTLARRHTVNIRRDLPRLIQAAVGRLGSLKVKQEERIAAYKERNVTDVEAHDVLVRAVDAGCLPVTRLPSVLAQWRKPEHVEFAPRTAWSLFNGFTGVYKQIGAAMALAQRTVPLHGLFDQLAGLRVMEEQFEDAEIVVRG